MSRGEQNGAGTALVAEDLSKHYQLGELHSLQQTVNRLLRRAKRGEAPSIEEVSHGESFGIVGTNGSGKSTLLQVLAGTIVPDRRGSDGSGRVLPLLAVGTGFHPELTGNENVTLFASSLGVPRSAIVDLVAIDDKLGGQPPSP